MNKAILQIRSGREMMAYELLNVRWDVVNEPSFGFKKSPEFKIPSIELKGRLVGQSYIGEEYNGDVLELLEESVVVLQKELMLNLKHQGYLK